MNCPGIGNGYWPSMIDHIQLWSNPVPSVSPLPDHSHTRLQGHSYGRVIPLRFHFILYKIALSWIVHIASTVCIQNPSFSKSLATAVRGCDSSPPRPCFLQPVSTLKLSCLWSKSLATTLHRRARCGDEHKRQHAAEGRLTASKQMPKHTE